MRNLLKASTVLAMMSPFIALAAEPGPAIVPSGPTGGTQAIATGNNLLGALGRWVGTLAVILIGVALIVFFVISYVLAGADEEKRATGRNLMIYGVIGLFVMVAIWGIVYLLANTLGVGIGGTPNIPLAPVPTIGGGGS